MLIYTYPITEEVSTYSDTHTQEGRQYFYTLIAIDDSGLESDPAAPLSITVPKTSLMPPIKKFVARIDKKNKSIELFWKSYSEDNVAELMIYKGLEDKPITLLRNLTPDAISLIDQEPKPNNHYVYVIRAVFFDGRVSETVSVNLKY